ncbi:hypothetical protein SELMODRAFT_404140 [Selaginella moellendorffii]|uniref:Uncharacterized protein n=1 Tax=Selaginella moellendorffii TaxID=88036 RepID=D8QUE4_SELML|nr:hypothetical protein SELMODRAFT_404140 [Selaginella moellendorffii]
MDVFDIRISLVSLKKSIKGPAYGALPTLSSESMHMNTRLPDFMNSGVCHLHLSSPHYDMDEQRLGGLRDCWRGKPFFGLVTGGPKTCSGRWATCGVRVSSYEPGDGQDYCRGPEEWATETIFVLAEGALLTLAGKLVSAQFQKWLDLQAAQ